MPRFNINPALLRWAAQRSGLPWESLAARIPRLNEWEQNRRLPTLKQLELFASVTHVPLGKLLLRNAPSEPLPLPDFRSRYNAASRHPSGNLLDTIYTCQIRQDWYRDYARSSGEADVNLRHRPDADTASAAAALRTSLDAPPSFPPDPYTALRQLTALADTAGVLVMASGVVGNNPHRKLAVDEFRGFAMADPVAPLVFINAADSLRAQVFTLVHELAHILRGQSAVSDAEPAAPATLEDERWCNQVAAAFLVPTADLDVVIREARGSGDLVARLRSRFPVSASVAMIRAHDLGLIGNKRLEAELSSDVRGVRQRQKPSGGNFYNTQRRRLGQRFARAVIMQAQEGQLTILDAMNLLGVGNMRTFEHLAARLEAD